LCSLGNLGNPELMAFLLLPLFSNIAEFSAVR
jgi:hypothetical protein